ASQPSSHFINADFSQLLNTREEEIKTLRNQLDVIKQELEQERVKNARLEAESQNAGRILEGKEQIIESKEQAIQAHESTIASQKTTIEALNNERMVITTQLQKYREPASTERAWYEFWKR